MLYFINKILTLNIKINDFMRDSAKVLVRYGYCNVTNMENQIHLRRGSLKKIAEGEILPSLTFRQVAMINMMVYFLFQQMIKNCNARRDKAAALEKERDEWHSRLLDIFSW